MKLEPTEADRRAADDWLDKAWDRPAATYFEEAYLAGVLAERERSLTVAKDVGGRGTPESGAAFVAELIHDLIRKGA